MLMQQTLAIKKHNKQKVVEIGTIFTNRLCESSAEFSRVCPAPLQIQIAFREFGCLAAWSLHHARTRPSTGKSLEHDNVWPSDTTQIFQFLLAMFTKPHVNQFQLNSTMSGTLGSPHVYIRRNCMVLFVRS